MAVDTLPCTKISTPSCVRAWVWAWARFCFCSRRVFSCSDKKASNSASVGVTVKRARVASRHTVSPSAISSTSFPARTTHGKLILRNKIHAWDVGDPYASNTPAARPSSAAASDGSKSSAIQMHPCGGCGAGAAVAPRRNSNVRRKSFKSAARSIKNELRVFCNSPIPACKASPSAYAADLPLATDSWAVCSKSGSCKIRRWAFKMACSSAFLALAIFSSVSKMTACSVSSKRFFSALGLAAVSATVMSAGLYKNAGPQASPGQAVKASDFCG